MYSRILTLGSVGPTGVFTAFSAAARRWAKPTVRPRSSPSHSQSNEQPRNFSTILKATSLLRSRCPPFLEVVLIRTDAEQFCKFLLVLVATIARRDAHKPESARVFWKLHLSSLVCIMRSFQQHY